VDSGSGSGARELPAMRAVAQRLGAGLIDVAAAELENVNTPADLARAQARLTRARADDQPNVKS